MKPIDELSDAEVLEAAGSCGPAIIGQKLFNRAEHIKKVNPGGIYGPAITGGTKPAELASADHGPSSPALTYPKSRKAKKPRAVPYNPPGKSKSKAKVAKPAPAKSKAKPKAKAKAQRKVKAKVRGKSKVKPAVPYNPPWLPSYSEGGGAGEIAVASL